MIILDSKEIDAELDRIVASIDASIRVRRVPPELDDRQHRKLGRMLQTKGRAKIGKVRHGETD